MKKQLLKQRNPLESINRKVSGGVVAVICSKGFLFFGGM